MAKGPLTQVWIPGIVTVTFLVGGIFGLCWYVHSGDRVNKIIVNSLFLFFFALGAGAFALEEWQRRAKLRKRAEDNAHELSTSEKIGKRVEDASDPVDVSEFSPVKDLEDGNQSCACDAPASEGAPTCSDAQVVTASSEAAGVHEQAKGTCPERKSVGGKSQVIYLMNIKTFLTFIVVTVHCVCQFRNKCTDGIGTMDAELTIENGVPNITHTSKNYFYQAGTWFIETNQAYFMSVFFLISGYFLPQSLDRKGFALFIKDKFVRLGGPLLLMLLVFMPLLYLWCYAYAGYTPLKWDYENSGPLWFVLWLLVFTCLYALIAQVMPVVKMRFPHPFLLLLLGCILGVALIGLFIGIGTDWIGAMLWAYGFAFYIPFFTAGVVGGRNNWLKDVENMNMGIVWCLRAIVLIWPILYALLLAGVFQVEGYPYLAWGASQGIFAMSMTLALLQGFHQYFNQDPPHKLVAAAGKAAYLVYCFHIWFVNISNLIYVEILRASGLTIIFSNDPPYSIAYYTLTPDGKPTFLSQGYLWGGFVFTFILTQTMVWPFAYYVRQLPILREML